MDNPQIICSNSEKTVVYEFEVHPHRFRIWYPRLEDTRLYNSVSPRRYSSKSDFIRIGFP